MQKLLFYKYKKGLQIISQPTGKIPDNEELELKKLVFMRVKELLNNKLTPIWHQMVQRLKHE